MAKLIDNESGNISKSITLTSVADSYKLSFNCSNIGNGKSFIRIYATLSDTSYKTYFFPIQFLNENEIEFSLDESTTFIQFDMIGDANVEVITLEEVTNATMEYVKANSTYWDRIKDITSNTGKVRADMMEGIINMAVNAFANDSGTITQENGVLTFLNGTTPEDSTQAVRITGGAIQISNNKNENGDWVWSTAITGAGINAGAITADTLNALTLSGNTILGASITGGTITGVTMEGGNAYFGDRDTGDYMEITANGNIIGYVKNKQSVAIYKSSEGHIHLGESIDSITDGYSLDLNSSAGYDDFKGSSITADGQDALILLQHHGAAIVIHNSGVNIYTPNHNGTMYIDGNIQCSGCIRAAGGVE